MIGTLANLRYSESAFGISKRSEAAIIGDKII
jgi:hypothetical protein